MADSLPSRRLRTMDAEINEHTSRETNINDNHRQPARPSTNCVRRDSRGPADHRRLQRAAPDDAFPLDVLARSARLDAIGDRPGSCVNAGRNGEERSGPICPVLPDRPQGRSDAGSLPQIVCRPQSGGTQTGWPATQRLPRTHIFLLIDHRTRPLRLHA
jgi:hypothetical protein